MSVTTRAINALADMAQFVRDLPEVFDQAAVMAINQVAGRDAPVKIRRRMREEINFPAGYLETRLSPGRKARRGSLEATITGRDRATSLARFTRQSVGNSRGKPIAVNVGTGGVRVLKKAFLVNLKNGNTGLAVRLKPGERMKNSKKAVMLDDNVALLYGPSVDQVFKGVADDLTPIISQDLSRQFLRQFQRLSRGR